MKTILTLLLAALAFATGAQPQKINYQAIALGSNGKPLKNTTVSLRLSVLDSAANGSVLYTETQPATTDASGQFSVYLGIGTPTAGMFASIPWANGNDKFLKVEMDAQGGTNYQVMGTTQLVSVPFAMAAGKANILEDSLGTQFQISYDGNGNPFLKLKLKPIPNCGSAVTYAGESYPTVQIGRQCWLAKNLNVGTMINSSASVDSQRNNGVTEKYCYNNDTANCTIYGGLYQWAEAVQYQNGAGISTSPSPAFSGNVRGICPTGWHLPSDAEWGTLETFLGGSSVAGGPLKSTSGLWTSPNNGATNTSEFSVLPGGFRYANGMFYDIGNYTYFWSSSESSSTNAFNRVLGYSYSDIFRYDCDKNVGFSARCIMDNCSPTTSTAGPDQLSLTGTTATLAANAPAAGQTGTWTITTGSGATLSNANSPTATLTKSTDSAYTLVWTITGPCGTSRDTLNLLFPAPVGTACGQAVSYAGESYPTVQIGFQCWFAKNLNVGTMIQGANDQTNNSTLEKYCYNNNPANCTTYGGLYQWAEAVQYQNGASNTTSPNPTFTGNLRGICPTGWHLPSDAEYCVLTVLIDSIGSNCDSFGVSSNTAGGALKSTTLLWSTPNVGANNSSSFSALPSGSRYPSGVFYDLGIYTPIWSSSESLGNIGIFRNMNYDYSYIIRNRNSKTYGFSVRCIQD